MGLTRRALSGLGLAILLCSFAASGQSKAATSTALTVATVSEPVTTVAAGTVVTLTATVQAGAAAVSPGQVNFCDASAAYCTDVHLLGTAQLTSAGTATLALRSGAGTHSFKAVFVGTNKYAGSASGASRLTVTSTAGAIGTTSTITQGGTWGAIRSRPR